MSDYTKFPSCGGEADNGHDRDCPPNPYYCSKCEATPPSNEALEALKALVTYVRISPSHIYEQVVVNDLEDTIRAALQKQEVDLESVKKEHPFDDSEEATALDDCRIEGWNECLDHLREYKGWVIK